MSNIDNELRESLKDKPVTYGYDPASPDGDYSALTVKKDGKFYSFVGDEADAIYKLVVEERLAENDYWFKEYTDYNQLTRDGNNRISPWLNTRPISLVRIEDHRDQLQSQLSSIGESK